MDAWMLVFLLACVGGGTDFYRFGGFWGQKVGRPGIPCGDELRARAEGWAAWNPLWQPVAAEWIPYTRSYDYKIP